MLLIFKKFGKPPKGTTFFLALLGILALLLLLSVVSFWPGKFKKFDNLKCYASNKYLICKEGHLFYVKEWKSEPILVNDGHSFMSTSAGSLIYPPGFCYVKRGYPTLDCTSYLTSEIEDDLRYHSMDTLEERNSCFETYISALERYNEDNSTYPNDLDELENNFAENSFTNDRLWRDFSRCDTRYGFSPDKFYYKPMFGYGEVTDYKLEWSEQ